MDCDISGYHVESYNFLADEGFQAIAEDIPPVKLKLPNGDAVEFWYTNARLGKPHLDNSKMGGDIGNCPIYPAECRQRRLTYRAPLNVCIDLQLNGRKIDTVDLILAEIPVMLCSNRCNLYGLKRKELIAKGEEALERGGYFIVNGSEKIMRLLIANKRNYPLAVKRKTFREKGKLYSEFAVMMRCFRGNHYCSLITLHYLESLSMTLLIQYRREIFYVPLIYVIKCLVDWNDAQIYSQLIAGRPNDQFWAKCVRNMLTVAQVFLN
uniref:DNA-directed RNA polymerase n=1 Tax=Meloidogyne incognita TaxID=6306 RepID=A0A914LL34_MELIC